MKSWIDRLKKAHMLSIIFIALMVIILLVAILINTQKTADIEKKTNIFQYRLRKTCNFVLHNC